MFTTSALINLILTYRYLILFPIAVAEGPFVSVVAGFFSAHLIFVWYLAFGLIILGDLVGDAIYYAIGRWGRERIVLRWGKYFGIEIAEVEKLEGYFKRHSGKTLLIGKWTQIAGLPVLVSAGISRMSFGIFMSYSLFGTLVKSSLLFIFGYFAGEAYKNISSYLDWISYFSIIVLILGLSYLIYRGWMKNNNKLNI